MITDGAPFQVMVDGGEQTAFRQIATCPLTGEEATFATYSAANHWLWLIREKVESERYRKDSHMF